MKIAIVGAGAIGGFLGGRLTRAGEDVALIARGPHLEAIRQHGLRIIEAEVDYLVQPPATDDPAEIGPVDMVVVTLKAHSLAGFAHRLQPLLGPQTPVVTAMNGLPWWYFQRHGGPWEGTHIKALDPKGAISDVIAAERVIGCVVYPSAEIAEPGVIRHTGGDRFTLGELDGAKTERIKAISGAILRAALKTPVRNQIRNEIWIKLMGNMAFNPLAALTGATLGQITSDAEASRLAVGVMEEATAVCTKLGIRVSITPEQRITGAAKLKGHKPSMLQDLEAGRPLELDSMLGAVLELAETVQVPMPQTQVLYSATKLLAQVRAVAT